LATSTIAEEQTKVALGLFEGEHGSEASCISTIHRARCVHNAGCNHTASNSFTNLNSAGHHQTQ